MNRRRGQSPGGRTEYGSVSAIFILLDGVVLVETYFALLHFVTWALWGEKQSPLFNVFVKNTKSASSQNQSQV